MRELFYASLKQRTMSQHVPKILIPALACPAAYYVWKYSFKSPFNSHYRAEEHLREVTHDEKHIEIQTLATNDSERKNQSSNTNKKDIGQ